MIGKMSLVVVSQKQRKGTHETVRPPLDDVIRVVRTVIHMHTHPSILVHFS